MRTLGPYSPRAAEKVENNCVTGRRETYPAHEDLVVLGIGEAFVAQYFLEVPATVSALAFENRKGDVAGVIVVRSKWPLVANHVSVALPKVIRPSAIFCFITFGE
jgi:hypothetical protein